LFAAGCEAGQPREAAPAAGAAPDTTRTAFALDTVASGLSTPWSLDFAPDGRIFVTERPGRIRVIRDGVLLPEPWATLSVAAAGEAGLMGIALSPGFENDRLVYVVGTFSAPDGGLVNRVLRLTDRDGAGTALQLVVDGIPAARFHAGDAIEFGPDGKLYIATGDAGNPSSAEDRTALGGKILRFNADGSIPDDNPFPGSPVYALGVRNVQGLAWHPLTGDLLATEHGPSGFPNERFRRNADELNVIRAGGNYGWPDVAGRSDNAAYIEPIVEWTPAVAPSGLAIYDGDITGWRGDAFVGALRGHLRRVTLARDSAAPTGWRVTEQEELFGVLGRIRAVAMGPDGYLYFSTSNRDGRGRPSSTDDHIFRVRPAGR
jgi:glucose/arabinose dehydrogenase